MLIMFVTNLVIHSCHTSVLPYSCYCFKLCFWYKVTMYMCFSLSLYFFCLLMCLFVCVQLTVTNTFKTTEVSFTSPSNIAVISVRFCSCCCCYSCSCRRRFCYFEDKLSVEWSRIKKSRVSVSQNSPTLHHPSCLVKLILASYIAFFSSCLKLLIYQPVNLTPTWISAETAFTVSLSALHNLTFISDVYSPEGKM
jgi:hypothetical protein